MEFFIWNKKVTKQKKPKQKKQKMLQCRREFRVQETICQELGSTYTRFQLICWVKNLLKRKQREEVQLPAMKRKWLLCVPAGWHTTCAVCNGVESFHSTLNVVFSVVIDDLSPFTATVCHLSVAISSIKIHRIVSFLVTSSETNYKSPFGMSSHHNSAANKPAEIMSISNKHFPHLVQTKKGHCFDSQERFSALVLVLALSILLLLKKHFSC